MTSWGLLSILISLIFILNLLLARGRQLSTYAKFSEKLTFLTPCDINGLVSILYRRGLEMLVFRKILRMYLMDDPQHY